MPLQPNIIPTNANSRLAAQIVDLRREISVLRRNAGDIQAGAIQGGLTGHIAPSSITTSEILAGTIEASDIHANAITAGQIAAVTITAAQIAADTITANEIASNAITVLELAAGAVTTNKMTAGTIDADRLTAGTITGSLLATSVAFADTLLSRLITSGSIVATTGLSAVSADLGTVTAGTLRIGVAGGVKTAIGNSISTSVGTKSGIVGTDASNNITFWVDAATGNVELKGTIKTGSSGLGNISGSIDGGTQINSGTVTGDRMVAHTITATQIAASTITATEIAANTITAAKIASGTITANEIAAGTITATQMTATAIDAMTITGATIRTGASGERVEMSTTGGVIGLKKYDASGNETVRIGKTNGLELLAGTGSSPPNDRMVTWRDASGNAIVSLSAYYGSSNGGLQIAQISPTGGVTAAAVMRANIASSQRQSSLITNVGTTDASAVVWAETVNNAGNFNSRRIIDGAGNSHFLQLATAADVKTAYGHDSVPGTGATSVSKAITHSLGRTAISAFAAANDPVYYAAAFVSSSTQITVQMRRVDGATFGTTPSFDWFVLG